MAQNGGDTRGQRQIFPMRRRAWKEINRQRRRPLSRGKTLQRIGQKDHGPAVFRNTRKALVAPIFPLPTVRTSIPRALPARYPAGTDPKK